MKLKLMITSLIAMTALLGTAAHAADSKGFSDVDFSTKQGQAIEKMYNAGYLAGYKDGTFKPNATITRAELTRVFNQVFKYELDEKKAADVADFKDIEKGVWYYNDVKIAQSNGYINGFNDNTFRPQENFTRQQTCVVLALAAGLQNAKTDIKINDEVSPWAETYVKAAISDGAFELENGGKFRATVNITRGEVCQALAKYVKTGEASSEATTSDSKATTKADNSTDKTETTTKANNSSSGGSNGSSGGGSNGGSNGGSSDTKVTTEATTEATTKAPVNTTTTTTEATTEATTEVIELNPAQRKALDNVIDDTENGLIYRVKTSEQKAIVNYILNAMKTYRNDPSFDVESAISEAKGMYYDLSDADRDQFYNAAMVSYNMSDVAVLKEIFGNLL